MSYAKIKCLHFTKESKAEEVAAEFRKAFNVSTLITQDSVGYIIYTTTDVKNSSRINAMHDILSNNRYNVIDGSYIRSYSYSNPNTADNVANEFELAFSVTASRYTLSDGKYGILVTGIPSVKLEAMHDLITTIYYNEISYDDVSDSNSISLPSGRRYNWNQFYPDIVNAIGSSAGCSITSALDVANIYGPVSFTIDDLKSGWSSTGYSFVLPSSCNGAIRGESYGAGTSDSTRFAVIRSEIDAGRPIIVKLYKDQSTVKHFVVAYGYTNGGTSVANIKVFDPGTDTTAIAGRNTTLADAISFNKKDGIEALRLTYKK